MKTKALSQIVCGLMTATLFSACSGPNLEGQWVEPIPGMESQMQGIHLEKGGKASSVNMATLQYEKWEKKGNKLILTGKSLGNHQTISFADTFTIDKATEKELTLKKGDFVINYKKK